MLNYQKKGSRTFECEERGANWLRGNSLWSLSSDFLLFQNIYIGWNPAISSLIKSATDATDCIWKQCWSVYVLQLHTTNSKLMMHLPNFTEIQKIKFVYLMHVLFDFILLIFIPAKFAFGIRSIDFYRQFRFFFL